jgi:hypothetical protein
MNHQFLVGLTIFEADDIVKQLLERNCKRTGSVLVKRPICASTSSIASERPDPPPEPALRGALRFLQIAVVGVSAVEKRPAVDAAAGRFSVSLQTP